MAYKFASKSDVVAILKKRGYRVVGDSPAAIVPSFPTPPHYPTDENGTAITLGYLKNRKIGAREGCEVDFDKDPGLEVFRKEVIEALGC